MKRLFKLCVGTLLLVTLVAVILTSGVFAQDNTIEVVVSPNVLNLNSNGGSVSLHTDIRYALVSNAELEVEGEPVDRIWTFADSRGDLVVKCNLDTVKGMVDVDVGEATFVLEVTTQDGTSYSGTDTITVIARGK
jgi:hypothetical protein